MKNPSDRWGPVSQLLHWSIVLLITAIATLGLLMVDMANTPDKVGWYALHKSLGLTLLALVLVRLGWRIWAGAPLPLPGLPRWQARTAALTHAALYLLMLAMPLSGWLFNSAAGYPLQWFGLLNLPAIAVENRDLRDLAGGLHEAGFWALLALVILHAGAAFYHHLFVQDATLTRMLPHRRRQE